MRYRAQQIIARLMLDHGQNSGEDQLRQWFESCLSRLRALPWTWNFEKFYGATFAPITLTETYTFTAGSDTITALVPSTALDDHTGRYLYANDEWFRVEKAADPANPNDIVLDRAYMGATIAGVSVTIVRAEMAFKSNGIKNVTCDSTDLIYRSSEQLFRSQRGNSSYIYDTPSKPAAYYIDKEREIPAPLYGPHITNTGAGTGPAAGEYEYFFTYHDEESGLESAPGPRVLYDGTTGHQLIIAYHDAAGSGNNVGENSYTLRLWRSKAIDKQARYPMWLIDTKVSLNDADACGGHVPRQEPCRKGAVLRRQLRRAHVHQRAGRRVQAVRSARGPVGRTHRRRGHDRPRAATGNARNDFLVLLVQARRDEPETVRPVRCAGCVRDEAQSPAHSGCGRGARCDLVGTPPADAVR